MNFKKKKNYGRRSDASHCLEGNPDTSWLERPVKKKPFKRRIELCCQKKIENLPNFLKECKMKLQSVYGTSRNRRTNYRNCND